MAAVRLLPRFLGFPYHKNKFSSRCGRKAIRRIECDVRVSRSRLPRLSNRSSKETVPASRPLLVQMVTLMLRFSPLTNLFNFLALPFAGRSDRRRLGAEEAIFRLVLGGFSGGSLNCSGSCSGRKRRLDRLDRRNGACCRSTKSFASAFVG